MKRLLVLVLVLVLSGCVTTNSPDNSSQHNIIIAVYPIDKFENSYYFNLNESGKLVCKNGTRQNDDISNENFIKICKKEVNKNLSPDSVMNLYRLADEVCKKNVDIQHKDIENHYNDAYCIEFMYKGVFIRQIYTEAYSEEKKRMLEDLIGFVPEHTSTELRQLVDEFVDVSTLKIELNNLGTNSLE